MRPTRRLAASLVLSGLLCSAAHAGNPADVPWDDIDRVLKQSENDPDQKLKAEIQPQPGGVRAEHSAADSPAPAPDAASTTLSPPQNVEPRKTPPGGGGEPATSAPATAINAPSPPPVEPKKDDQPAAVTATPTAPAAPQSSAAAPPAASIIANGNLIYLPASRYLQSEQKKSLAGFNDADRQTLTQFYGSRMGAPVWVTKAGYNDEARNLIAAFKDADNWGLNSADYKIFPLQAGADGELSFDDLTKAEVALSLAAMAYARDARGDRITSPSGLLSAYLDRTPQLVDRRTVIDTLATTPDQGAYLRSLQPKQPQFELLRQKLISMRGAAKEAEALKIPDGPKLMPGTSHPQIAILRKVLKVPAPAVQADGKPADDTYYDAELAKAVQNYKDKKGLAPANPAITTALRRSLNSSNDISETKILANMEQWRWMPADLGKYYVNVNIPEFLVRVIKDGEVIHEERIVSGRYDTETPIFSSPMRTIVFQPRWNVPDSIKIKELLPSLRSGGNPLARQGLVMEYNGRRIDPYGQDWFRYDIRNFNVYQPPGGGNALGVVKFLFPNKHSVYLHDTPSKSLFNEPVRMFSHGCMRVRNPEKLAQVILAQDKGWEASVIDGLIKNGPEENEVALSTPIPVHVTYFTASVAKDGTVQAFDDVYGHEKRITLALQGKWNQIVKNDPQAVSPDDIVGGDGWFADGPKNGGGFAFFEDEPRKGKKSGSAGNLFNQIFGGGF